MPAEIVRILSDIHYGEHASRVHSLEQLRPLSDGATSLLLNGDTLDTRPGPDPELNARTRSDVRDFFSGLGIPVKFLTGNHDPDISPNDLADLAGGKVFVTHGDILFADIVPWGRDAALISELMAKAVAELPNWEELSVEQRLRIIRRIAAAIPQRHQAELNPLKYAIRFAKDTIWPPTRITRVLRAWSEVPERAAALLARDRPKARFILIGHTHRPGIWPLPSGATIINTGAYCWPSGSLVVDLLPERLIVRQVVTRRGAYSLGRNVAEFALNP